VKRQKGEGLQSLAHPEEVGKYKGVLAVEGGSFQTLIK